MKRLSLIVCLMLGLACSQFAQDEPAARISTAALKKIFAIVLRSEFKPAAERKVIYLNGRTLREVLLPEIANIQFVIVDDTGLRNLGKAHLFKGPFRERNTIYVNFGFGDGCNASGDRYSFRVRGNRVTRLDEHGGWGSGCGSGIGTGH